MNSTPSWYQANFQYLLSAIERVHQFLKIQIEQTDSAALSDQLPHDFPSFTHPESSTLEILCNTFNLSSFERDILLLCLGMELDVRFPSLCTQAQGSPELPFPTFSLALLALPDAHISAIAPHSPLQHWQLLEIGQGQTLTLSPLRLDKRILFYLLGEGGLDAKLVGYVQPLPPLSPHSLPPSHQQVADQIAATWSQGELTNFLPIVQLCGSLVEDQYAIAAAACEQSRCNLYLLNASRLPLYPADLFHLKRRWEREALLTNSVLLLDCEEISQGNGQSSLSQFLEGLELPFILCSPERLPSHRFTLITFNVPQLTHSEQRDLWQTHLGPDGEQLNGHVDAIVSQFNLSPSAIQASSHQFKIHKAKSEGENYLAQNQLWDICLSQARPRLEDLSQRIEATATWDDLVLPEQERTILADMAVHLRQRTKVYQDWGFAKKGKRGLGISALFHGASGTGKTMAAEVLANEFRLDLYRIDLSAIVSKYVGETEKNLRRIFDAAETGGAILLFDEADALFAKRTEVKDSHDRYANIEVSYLLQRMEAYQGLAIMTTNLKNSIDQAFERRLRFVVGFPFPDAQARAEIWRRVFPQKTPTTGLDLQKLSKLNLAGGNIRNIALNAAFMAADAGEPVMMKYILEATKREYVKKGSPVTDTEIKGWL